MGAGKMGKVILLGAGPGDRGLLTLRGLEALKDAEVVVYDALVGVAILAEIPRTAKTIYVGKRAGQHSKTQEEINEIINISVRQTMVRSINTVLTVLITVLAMMFLGSESIFNFNLGLLIGLLTGMYSSILIAAPLYGILKGKELKKKGTLKTYKEKRINPDQPQVGPAFQTAEGLGIAVFRLKHDGGDHFLH